MPGPKSNAMKVQANLQQYCVDRVIHILKRPRIRFCISKGKHAAIYLKPSALTLGGFTKVEDVEDLGKNTVPRITKPCLL